MQLRVGEEVQAVLPGANVVTKTGRGVVVAVSGPFVKVRFDKNGQEERWVMEREVKREGNQRHGDGAA